MLASRSSAASPDGVAGLAPSSVSARRSHLDSVIGWTPKSVAICSSATPGSRLRATFTSSSRNSFGYGLGTATSLQAASQQAQVRCHPTLQQSRTANTPDMTLFAAITYVLVSGCAWRALPPCFGVSKSTAHRRFLIWSRAGVRGRLHEAILHRLDESTSSMSLP